MHVAGRRSAFAFKGTNDDTRVIAGELGVGAVLEGSVRKDGQRIRITAQLVRAQDGFSLGRKPMIARSTTCSTSRAPSRAK